MQLELADPFVETPLPEPFPAGSWGFGSEQTRLLAQMLDERFEQEAAPDQSPVHRCTGGSPLIPGARSLVVNTRPLRQSLRFTQALRRANYAVLCMPASQTNSLLDAAHSQAISPRLDNSDLLLITSREALRHLQRAVPDAGRQVPVLAIGPATAQAVRDAGWHLEWHSPVGLNAELLVDALIDRLRPATRLLLARGAQGRELLPRQLQRAGLHVDELHTHRSQPLELPETFWRHLLDNPQAVVIFTSGYAAAKFVSAARVRGLERFGRTLVIGEPTRKALEDIGWHVDAQAQSMDTQGLIDLLNTLEVRG